MSYPRFGAMIATSTIVMFGLMYLNTYALDHVWFSQTRAWMAVVMGATMAVIMLGFILGMYRDKRVNLAIFSAAILAFAFALFLVRSQETVGDVSYMKVMIPHHSIAIMTSGGRISRPARAQARRRDHRGAGPGDRRDGAAHCRSRTDTRSRRCSRSASQ